MKLTKVCRCGWTAFGNFPIKGWGIPSCRLASCIHLVYLWVAQDNMSQSELSFESSVLPNEMSDGWVGKCDWPWALPGLRGFRISTSPHPSGPSFAI